MKNPVVNICIDNNVNSMLANLRSMINCVDFMGLWRVLWTFNAGLPLIIISHHSHLNDNHINAYRPSALDCEELQSQD